MNKVVIIGCGIREHDFKRNERRNRICKFNWKEGVFLWKLMLFTIKIALKV